MTLRNRLILALAMESDASSRFLRDMVGATTQQVCKALARMEADGIVRRTRIRTPIRTRDDEEKYLTFTWRLNTPSATVRQFGLWDLYKERLSA